MMKGIVMTAMVGGLLTLLVSGCSHTETVPQGEPAINPQANAPTPKAGPGVTSPERGTPPPGIKIPGKN